jgi:predicted ATP-dependent endonuclease of OLD family
MKLEQAQVIYFRNILDSGEVRIEPDVTCFVGKNESGKTSFLQALHALNPAVPTPMEVLNYPAWLAKQHQLEGKVLEETEAVKMEFLLTEEEQAELHELFGGAVKSHRVSVSRNYAGTIFIGVEFHEPTWTGHFIEDRCAGLPLTKPAPTSAKSLAERLQALAEATPDEGQEDVRPLAAQARQALQAACGNEFDAEAPVRKWVTQHLPKFLYVGRYALLPGKIDIQRIGSAPYEQLDEHERIAKALLELSSADVDLAMSGDYERRVRELNDTANALTQEILEFWTQNQNIRVDIDFDQETRNNQSVVKCLHVRLYDSEHMIGLPFGERSSGFQWFFSFLCAFSRYRLSKEPVILLLDEPALGLHARAQRDFLRYIDEKLAPRCQVLFSTHSPFMVQPERMERVRLVEDRGRKVGSRVSDDVLTTDRDTVFPLQGALGYDLAQNLFVGSYNLVVEGTSDFVYLQVLSDYLKGKGRTGLDERCTIVPVGGANKVATFAALLGSHVDATILIDSTKQGNQALDALVGQGILKESRIIGVGEIVGRSDADIEDMFSVDEYLALFNEAFSSQWTASDLKGTDPIVRQLARAVEKDRYNHGKPAEVLLRKSKTTLNKLTKATLDRFEALFTRINKTFPSDSCFAFFGGRSSAWVDAGEKSVADQILTSAEAATRVVAPIS